MFKQLVRHIIEGSTYFGLEIFEVGGKEQFALLQIAQKKRELEVILEKTSENLDELLPLIDAKAPLFITLNTSKVLKKEVSNEIKHNEELLVVNAFPNLELDNFYYQVLNATDNSIVGISKKEYIEWYLDQLQKIGLKPFSVVLGIAQINAISSFIEGTIRGSNFNLTILNENVVSLKLEEQIAHTTIDLDGISLQNNSLLNFSHIAGYLQGNAQVNNLKSNVEKFQNDFKNMKLFDAGLKASLAFFLLLLLGNFLMFNSYNSKNQLLESSLTIDSQNGSIVNILKERVKSKEERVQTLSNSKNSKTSYYLDEIAKGLPQSIWLSDLKFQPLLFPVRKDKPIELNKNRLEISGIINNKIAFTVWSDNLEMQKWVDKVEIIDYEYISNSSASFTVNVLLHETQ